jgi:antitoxin YefM
LTKRTQSRTIEEGCLQAVRLRFSDGLRAKFGDQTMTSMTVTEARANLYRLIDDIAQSHEPVLITGKRGSAMLIAEDDWRSIEETLFLLNIPGMRESIIAGMETPLHDCDDEVAW